MLFLVYVLLLLVKFYGRMPMLEELFNQTKRRCTYNKVVKTNAKVQF